MYYDALYKWRQCITIIDINMYIYDSENNNKKRVKGPLNWEKRFMSNYKKRVSLIHEKRVGFIQNIFTIKGLCHIFPFLFEANEWFERRRLCVDVDFRFIFSVHVNYISSWYVKWHSHFVLKDSWVVNPLSSILISRFHNTSYRFFNKITK